jgi:prepilin-type N-terminal cleavage/methylation domain-containing protein
MTLRKHRGFSLLELMITVSIAMILMGVTFIGLKPVLYRAHIDSTYDTALMVLRNTRHLAITQSHEYKVVFDTGAQTIQVQYQPPSVGGIAPPLQVVNTWTLPNDMRMATHGYPASAPDGFGTGANAVDFGQSLAGAPYNYVTFYPDGSSRDMIGNYNNGVMYITRPSGTVYDSRAITVWGTTGRVRGWRLDSVGGVTMWVQQ